MKNKIKNLVALATIAFIGTALADEIAQLRPAGKAIVVMQRKTQEISKPTTVALKPGDQVCVKTGKLEFVRAGKKQNMEAGQCLQISAKRSDGGSVAQFVVGLVNNPKTFDNQNAQSRNADCGTNCAAPGLQIPSNYNLPEVLLPMSGRPNPKTLRLTDASGKTILQLQDKNDDSVFKIPTSSLRKSRHIEITSATKDVLYSGDVYAVSTNESNTDPTSAAGSLLATQLIEYAPVAYSYLVKAGETESAKKLEQQIRLSFVGQ